MAGEQGGEPGWSQAGKPAGSQRGNLGGNSGESPGGQEVGPTRREGQKGAPGEGTRMGGRVGPNTKAASSDARGRTPRTATFLYLASQPAPPRVFIMSIDVLTMPASP